VECKALCFGRLRPALLSMAFGYLRFEGTPFQMFAILLRLGATYLADISSGKIVFILVMRTY
jgi:hypothetical protein